MKILSVSDVVDPILYSPGLTRRCGKVDLLISCGDIPMDYLEYISSVLGVSLHYVHGNHVRDKDETDHTDLHQTFGGIDLHRNVIRHASGALLAGIEGCLRYRGGKYLYSQTEMWMMVFGLVPGLLRNRIQYGRYLDIFVTHAPEWHIHDDDDLPHRGIKAFNWLVKVFQPKYNLHAHVHVYRPDIATETRVGETRIINTYGYKILDLDMESYQLVKNTTD